MSKINLPQIIVRDSTGLTKAVGFFDSFFFNFNNQNVGLGVAFLFLALEAYPGADLVLGVIIALGLVFPSYLIYAWMSSIMPRSGGDYVWVSRVIHPAFGFATSWNWLPGMFVAIGWPAAFFAQYGLAPILRSIGAYTSNQNIAQLGNLVSSNIGVLLIGTLLIIFFAVVMIRGNRLFMWIQNVSGLIAIAGVILVLFTVLTSSQHFEDRFNQYVENLGGVTDAYSKVSGSALVSDDRPDQFNFTNTLLSMVWTLYMINFGLTTSFIGGEVKNPKQNQVFGMIASLLLTSIGICVLVMVFTSRLERSWLAALAEIEPDRLGLDFIPTYNELAAIMSGNIVLAGFINFSFLFWTYLWLPINLMSATRNILAWALDGLLPDKVTQVHQKYHTPVGAIVICCVIGWFCLLGFVLGFFTLLVGVFGQVLSIGIGCLAAVALPYRRPDLYALSPVRSRILGIPLLSVVGVFSLLGIVIIELLYFFDPVGGISNSFGMIVYNFGIFFTGFLIYYVVRTRMRRRGVMIELAFKEIPLE